MYVMDVTVGEVAKKLNQKAQTSHRERRKKTRRLVRQKRSSPLVSSATFYKLSQKQLSFFRYSNGKVTSQVDDQKRAEALESCWYTWVLYCRSPSLGQTPVRRHWANIFFCGGASTHSPVVTKGRHGFESRSKKATHFGWHMEEALRGFAEDSRGFRFQVPARFPRHSFIKGEWASGGTRDGV